MNTPKNIFKSTISCLSEQQMYDYLEGILSATEEHKIEKHLLECTYCQDVMDGLMVLKNNSVSLPKATLEVHKKIDDLTRPAKPKYWLMAASFLVIVSVSFVLYYFLQHKNEQTFAHQKSEETQPASIPQIEDSDMEDTPNEQTKNTIAQEMGEKKDSKYEEPISILDDKLDIETKTKEEITVEDKTPKGSVSPAQDIVTENSSKVSEEDVVDEPKLNTMSSSMNAEIKDAPTPSSARAEEGIKKNKNTFSTSAKTEESKNFSTTEKIKINTEVWEITTYTGSHKTEKIILKNIQQTSLSHVVTIPCYTYDTVYWKIEPYRQNQEVFCVYYSENSQEKKTCYINDGKKIIPVRD